MKNYYIVTFTDGNKIGNFKYIGSYDKLSQAKESVISIINENEMLVGFDSNINPKDIIDLESNTVNLNLAKKNEKVYWLKTDNNTKNAPTAGVYYWSDNIKNTTYYTAYGKIYDENANNFKVEYAFAINASSVYKWETIDEFENIEAETAENAAKQASHVTGLEKALFKVSKLILNEYGRLEPTNAISFFKFY